MALSTDYALRTGAFEPAEASVNAQDLQGSCEYAGEGGEGPAWERAGCLASCVSRTEAWGYSLCVWEFLISLVLHLLLSPSARGRSAGDKGEGSEPIQPCAGECVPAASMASSVLPTTGPYNTLWALGPLCLLAPAHYIPFLEHCS